MAWSDVAIGPELGKAAAPQDLIRRHRFVGEGRHDLGAREGVQLQYRAPPGQALREGSHQRELLGAGHEEAPIPGTGGVDSYLQVAKEPRRVLDLVEDHRLA